MGLSYFEATQNRHVDAHTVIMMCGENQEGIARERSGKSSVFG